MKCKECTHCPFAHTEPSEYIQNSGCLPEPFDAVSMKINSGHNWACHDNENKICTGFVGSLDFFMAGKAPSKESLRIGGLIRYGEWDAFGTKIALDLADARYKETHGVRLAKRSLSGAFNSGRNKGNSIQELINKNRYIRFRPVLMSVHFHPDF